jgi:uncharacterized membrane protein HdeD (DUF308 family)
MFTQLVRSWWMFAVRGVLAIVFGILALISPESTKVALVWMFGAFTLVDGIFAVAAGVATRGVFERWWALLLEGIAGIVIGLTAFFWTDLTALALLYLIAAWAIVTGILEIVAAIQYRHVISGEWAMILGGALSVILGVMLFVYPSAGTVGIVWSIGMYAIAAGIIEIIFAFRLRGLKQDLERTTIVVA